MRQYLGPHESKFILLIHMFFIIALRRYPELCEETYFVTGKGTDSKCMPLKSIYSSLGAEVCNALPGLHALFGADITGSFSGKAKKSWWNVFSKTTSDIMAALAKLGLSETLEDRGARMSIIRRRFGSQNSSRVALDTI